MLCLFSNFIPQLVVKVVNQRNVLLVFCVVLYVKQKAALLVPVKKAAYISLINLVANFRVKAFFGLVRDKIIYP